MQNKKTSVWQFLASVKLALITLILLALTSILGTLIKQNQGPDFYIQEYGSSLADLIQALDLNTMYSSWWYVGLLGLFALNLTICSIERLPRIWKQIKKDPSNLTRNQLNKMSLTHRLETDLSPREVMEVVTSRADDLGLKKFRAPVSFSAAEKPKDIYFASEKGSWTRLGVYVVHLSILIVLLGAIAGSLLGFQAYVYLPEMGTVEEVFQRKSRQPLPLGFTLRSESFRKTFYPNGMIKQYFVNLAVLDSQKKENYEKTVSVNDPLSYQGINFYIGDAYPMEAFFVVLRDTKNRNDQAFRMPAGKDAEWKEAGVSFRIDEVRADQEGEVRQVRIQMNSAREKEPRVFWMNDDETREIYLEGDSFTISLRQLYSTLLLVVKDPGIYIVYSGFILLMVGLAISFGMAYKRVYLCISPGSNSGSEILLAGQSNKHKAAFENQFQCISNRLEEIIPVSTVGQVRSAKSIKNAEKKSMRNKK